MIERDDHIPPLGELVAELEQARALARARCRGGAGPQRPQTTARRAERLVAGGT